MSARKVRLLRPQPLAANVLHGAPLRPSVRVQGAYEQEWADLCDEMHREAWKALKGYATSGTVAQDAIEDFSFWRAVSELRLSLERKFLDAAGAMAGRMIAGVDKSATSNLRRSLKEIAPSFTVKLSDPEILQDEFRDRIAENVRLIKRIPREYMDVVVSDVQKAVIEGRGLNDLQRIMEARYGTAKRWARQVALDQTNKAYRDVNATRMRQSGVRKFRWLHTSVPKHPRHFHKLSHDAGGLNGGVFDLDNPPVIDQATGRRGLPGDDYFCHCIMQPVVDV